MYRCRYCQAAPTHEPLSFFTLPDPEAVPVGDKCPYSRTRYREDARAARTVRRFVLCDRCVRLRAKRCSVSKTIVVCCDGPNNKFGGTNTNIVKLYSAGIPIRDVFFLISGLLDESSAISATALAWIQSGIPSYWLAKAAAKQDVQPRCFVREI